MAKASGSTRSSVGNNVDKLYQEGKSLGITKSTADLFEKARMYGNMNNAPQSFSKKFIDRSSQDILTFVNKQEKIANTKRSKEVRIAFEKGSESMYNAAQRKYEKRMQDVRDYASKLREIQSNFQ